VTIYTISYNEELLLRFFIKWYRDRFPDCKIVIYDNYSTDSTEEIAIKNGCEVIKYDSGGEIRDDIYLEIKNNCWKKEKGWAIVCDVDELMDVNEEYLSTTQYDIIGGKGFEMVGTDSDSLETINRGTYNAGYSKLICFNTERVTEINYSAGCHVANPKGANLKTGTEQRPLYHFKWVNGTYPFERYKLFSERMSKKNKDNGWAIHYDFSLKVQQDYYNSLLKTSIKVL